MGWDSERLISHLNLIRKEIIGIIAGIWDISQGTCGFTYVSYVPNLTNQIQLD
jgi:hypothetical protein